MDKYDAFIRPIRLDFDDENPDFSPEELKQIDISGLEYANEYKKEIIWSFDTSGRRTHTLRCGVRAPGCGSLSVVVFRLTRWQ